MQRRRFGRHGARVVAALLLTAAVATATPPPAVALPTASFSFGPLDPAVGEPVAFTFTGTRDEPPCRIQWRWFRAGGSTVGTAMGEGEQVSQAFARPGDHRVVVKVTGAGSTHGSATATQVVSVVVDNRSATVVPRRARVFTGLPDGPHRATVQLLDDDRGPARMTVDTFEVPEDPA